MVNIDMSAREQSQGRVSTYKVCCQGGWGGGGEDSFSFGGIYSSLTCVSLGTGSSRTWLLADSRRTSGKARTTAEGAEGEGSEERRRRMGNSGRMSTAESERREVHSWSRNTMMMGSIFTCTRVEKSIV